MKKLFVILGLMLLFNPSVSALTNACGNDEDCSYSSKKFNYDDGDDLLFNKQVFGSNAIFGDNVKSSGIVEGINAIFGNNVTYNGESDYGFIFGNNINVEGYIINDGAIFGNQIVFDKDSKVGRDIAIFGNNVTLKGTFERDVVVYADTVNIEDATILGSIKIDANNIIIDSNTRINVQLSYPFSLKEKITIDKDALINNITTFKEEVVEESMSEIIFSKVLSLISILVIFSVIYFLSPKLFNKLDKDIIKAMGFGLVFLIVIPVLGVLLLISVLGVGLGLLLLALYTIILLLSSIFTGYLCGDIIWNKLIKSKRKEYLVGILGITIIFLLKLIPVVGWLITFLSLLVGLGSICLLFKRKKK